MSLTKILVPICLYCLNCTKFGPLIFNKIIKIVATRCHTFRLKCSKFDFGWGSARDPAGELTAHPQPQLDLRGSTSKFREESGRERSGREGRGEKGGTGGEGNRFLKS